MSFEQNRLAWPGVNDVCGAARHAGGPAAYGQVYGGLKRPSRVTLVTSSDPTGLWSPDGAKRPTTCQVLASILHAVGWDAPWERKQWT